MQCGDRISKNGTPVPPFTLKGETGRIWRRLHSGESGFDVDTVLAHANRMLKSNGPINMLPHASDLFQLAAAGLLAQGRLAEAQTAGESAMAAALLSGDQDRVCASQVRLCHVLHAMGDYRRILRAVLVTRRHGATKTPALHGSLCLSAALAHASLGEEQEAKREITAAYECVRSSASNEFYLEFTLANVQMHEMLVLFALGRIEEAHAIGWGIDSKTLSRERQLRLEGDLERIKSALDIAVSY